MSFADFQRGHVTANFFNQIAADRADRAADAAIDKWEAYANRLEDRVESMNQKYGQLSELTCTSIGVANGRKDAIDELMNSLREVNPHHPLLVPGVVDSIVNDGATEYAASKGYIYDPETRTVHKR